MLESIIESVFKRTGQMWHLKTGKDIAPNQEDILVALDHAAAVLYDEPNGTRLATLGMIIEKHETHNSVYVYAGQYR